MKKMMKKLTCIVAAAAMLVSMMAASASASISYEKTKVAYYVKNGSNSNSIYVSGTNAVKKSSVKTSNKKVVSLNYLDKSSYKYETQYFTSSQNDYSYSGKYNYIGVNIEGTGSASVSYKIGSKTYKTEFKVYKYKNPVKTLTIKGINGGKNVASSFKSTNNVSGKKLSKTQSGATITIAAKSGWKITWAYYSGDGVSRYVSSSKGLSKVTLHPGKLKKGKSQSVNVTFQNTKTGGTVSCYYSFS